MAEEVDNITTDTGTTTADNGEESTNNPNIEVVVPTPDVNVVVPTPDVNVVVPTPDVNIDIPPQHDYSSYFEEYSSYFEDYSSYFKDYSSYFEEYSSYFSDITDYIEVIKKIDEEEHEVNKTAPKDYWDKLRHQYFITVLQSILTRTGVFTLDQLINISYKITTAAINKMKATTD